MISDIKFGVSTWLWTSPFTTESIDDLFPKVAGMGFDMIEIAVEDPALIDILKVKQGLRRYNLKALLCGAFGPTKDFTSEDAAIHKNCFSYVETCLEFCSELEIDFFGGPMYSAVGKARMVPAEQRKREWFLAVKNLSVVCEMAQKRGLKIGIEPLNRFESDLINNVDDVIRLIEDINHPSAQIMLDSFHMSIEEKDVENTIKKAGDKLIHLQVSENYRGVPGTGQTNWAAYKKGLEAINYRRTVSIESFTPDNKELAEAVCFWHPMAKSQDQFAIDGIKFLKELFNTNQ